MKVLLIVIAGFIILLGGCISDEVGGVYMVTEKFDDLPSAKNHGVQVYFQAGDTWKAMSTASWLAIEPSEGKSGRNGIVLRTTEANHTRERREATVTIASGGKQQLLTVWQRNDYALFDQREYHVDADGGEVNMTFQSNVNKDSLLIMFIPMEWITWDTDSINTRAGDWSGKIKTLYVDPNPIQAERLAYFILVRNAEKRIDYQVLDTTWVRQAGNPSGQTSMTDGQP